MNRTLAIGLLVALAAALPVWAQETAAKWVWYPEQAAGECVDESRFFRKSFEAPEGCTAATLLLVVDDRQTVWFNGQGPIERLEGKDIAPTYDLTSLLRPGKNVIAVQGHNVTGPAGLLARLVVKRADGEEIVLGSDASWRVARESGDDWTSVTFDDTNWAGADVIGGAFTRPWADFPGYHSVDLVSAEELAAYRRYQDGLLAPAEQFADEAPAQAALRQYNGAPVLFINDVPTPLVMYRSTIDPVEPFGRRQIANFRDAGVHLFCPYVALESCWKGPGEYDFSLVDDTLRAFLSADPDAHLILLVRLIPPEWWMEANPDEWVAYGTSPELDSGDEARRVRRASPASAKWLEDAGQAWRDMIRHLEAQPWGKRVVGYHACYGIYAEWHYFGGWTDQYPDTGSAMTRTFRGWLREKYGTEQALREAWGDDQVTLDTATVPGVEPRKTATLGTLRDPARERRVIDYYHCQQRVIADDIEHFGRIAKEESKGRAIYGIYYGYFFGVRPQTQGGHLELERLAQSPNIDYFVAPYSYSQRLMGEDGRLRSLAAVLNRAGKAHILEGDIRTYLHPREEYGRTQNLTESIAAIRREFTTALIEHAGFWFVDFGPAGRGGWFDEPHIMEQVANLRGLAQRAMQTPRRSVAQVALVTDLESGYCLSDSEGMSLAYGLIEDVGTEMYHLGAPLDAIMLRELERTDLSQYKVLVFLNTFSMTESQADLVEKLRKSGKHATVFLWAPGLCGPEDVSPERASRVTGLPLKLMDQWLPGQVNITGDAGALVAGLPPMSTHTIEPESSAPVAEFSDVTKWHNPRTPQSMEKDYRLYEVTGAEGGIRWDFDTSYSWTDIHFNSPVPEGDGLSFDVELVADYPRLALRYVIKDANWAEFVAPARLIMPGEKQTLQFPLEAFTNAPWSKLKPEKPALPLNGMKFVLDSTRDAGPCAITFSNLQCLHGGVKSSEFRSFGGNLFAPALIADEGAGRVLGRIQGTTYPGLVASGEGASLSVFSATPFIPRQVLAEVLRKAGVHRYVDSLGDVVRADSRYLAIHTKDGGDRALALPEAFDVKDAITGQQVGSGTSAHLDLPANSTTILEMNAKN